MPVAKHQVSGGHNAAKVMEPELRPGKRGGPNSTWEARRPVGLPAGADVLPRCPRVRGEARF